MKPPICHICGKRFGPDEGGLVYFALRPSDKEWRDRMKATGGVGHPPNAAWFCDCSYAEARDLSNLTIDKAMTQLREKMGK